MFRGIGHRMASTSSLPSTHLNIFSSPQHQKNHNRLPNNINGTMVVVNPGIKAKTRTTTRTKRSPTSDGPRKPRRRTPPSEEGQPVPARPQTPDAKLRRPIQTYPRVDQDRGVSAHDCGPWSPHHECGATQPLKRSQHPVQHAWRCCRLSPATGKRAMPPPLGAFQPDNSTQSEEYSVRNIISWQGRRAQETRRPSICCRAPEFIWPVQSDRRGKGGVAIGITPSSLSMRQSRRRLFPNEGKGGEPSPKLAQFDEDQVGVQPETPPACPVTASPNGVSPVQRG